VAERIWTNRAVAVGLLVATGPVVALFGVPFLVLSFVAEEATHPQVPSSLAVAFVVAWLSWSWMVPRWRLSTYARVCDLDGLLRKASRPPRYGRASTGGEAEVLGRRRGERFG